MSITLIFVWLSLSTFRGLANAIISNNRIKNSNNFNHLYLNFPLYLILSEKNSSDENKTVDS